MATLEKGVSKGSQSWRPLPHTSNHNYLLLPFRLSSQGARVGKRKLSSFKAQYWLLGHSPLRMRQAVVTTDWGSFQVHHPGPLLSKLMTPLYKWGPAKLCPRGNGRRKQMSFGMHRAIWHMEPPREVVLSLWHSTASTWWPLSGASDARLPCGWLLQQRKNSWIKVLVRRKKLK